MPVLADNTKFALNLARGERLAGASSLVGAQADFHAWRHERNEWIQSVSSTLADAGMAYEAEGFRRAATVRQPFSHWQLALTAEVNAVCGAIHELRRQLA
jgi:hypothetical protein